MMLHHSSNHLESEQTDYNSLTFIFRRRLGDREAWDCFSKWVNTHIEDVGQLSLKAITIVAYAFVNLGVEVIYFTAFYYLRIYRVAKQLHTFY